MLRRSLLIAGLMVPVAARAAAGPAVLELFTSQGCSSCPPADALLGELARQPGVIALAWHVDYWNNLGWKDPYARPQWTERQRAYARLLRDEVYTPALVINGAAMVVGSDRPSVTRTMAGTPGPRGVALRRTGAGIEAAGLAIPSGASAQWVVYDPSAATAVAAGENAGRHLNEYRIVRETHDVTVSDGPMMLAAVGAGRGAALLVRDAGGRLIAAGDSPPA
jgi:hypothetical protein